MKSDLLVSDANQINYYITEFAKMKIDKSNMIAKVDTSEFHSIDAGVFDNIANAMAAAINYADFVLDANPELMRAEYRKSISAGGAVKELTDAYYHVYRLLRMIFGVGYGYHPKDIHWSFARPWNSKDPGADITLMMNEYSGFYGLFKDWLYECSDGIDTGRLVLCPSHIQILADLIYAHGKGAKLPQELQFMLDHFKAEEKKIR